MFSVQPSRGFLCVALDLPRQLVGNGPSRLDLTPHAGRDCELRCEHLLDAFRRHAGRDLLRGVFLEKCEDVVSSNDGDIRHCVLAAT